MKNNCSRWGILTLGILFGTAAAGCTAGRYFEPRSADSFVLRETTRRDIESLYGSPFRVGSIVKNGHQMQAVAYAYASNTGGGHADGVIPAKFMTFHFLEDRLVSYEYTSSYDADHTDFDDSRVPEIRKGESTREQVVALIGRPAGKCVFPVIAGKDDQGISYTYHQTSKKFLGGFHIYRKSLVVSFGPDGRVSDLQFTVDGEK